jgi:hypothetical protein
VGKIRFAQLPLSVKIAMAFTFYNTFVLFEELVIDRGGWYRYLPWYKFQHLCAWDYAAIALILVAIFGAGRFIRDRAEPGSAEPACYEKDHNIPAA